jgi:hypothetical protein
VNYVSEQRDDSFLRVSLKSRLSMQ